MQQQQGADFANLLISATVVIIFVGSIWYLIRKANKNNLTVGQHLNRIFMREESTILIMLIGGMNIMEALVAASIHPQGGSQVNPVARFAMHLMFGLAGAFCAINAPKKIMEFFKDTTYFFGVVDVKNPKNNRKAKPIIPIIDLLLGLGLLTVSIGLPYGNVLIMSTGLGEADKFHLAIMQLRPWFNNASVGITDPTYSATEHMTMIMQASWIALIAHVFIAVLDGLFALYERNKYDLDKQEEERTRKGYGIESEPQKSDIDKKITEKGEKKSEAQKQQSVQLTYLFNFLDIKDQDKKHTYFEAVMKAMADNVGQVSAGMSGSLTEWYDKIVNFNDVVSKDAQYSTEDLKRQREELKVDLLQFFRDKPKDGGFGIDIAKK
jgi:hypothetical protein